MRQTTEVYGITADELRNIIVSDVKEELVKLIKNLIPIKKEEDEFLTRKEASAMLKVSLQTITDWSKKGIINPMRIGNLIRFRKSDLEKALIEINKDS